MSFLSERLNLFCNLSLLVFFLLFCKDKQCYCVLLHLSWTYLYTGGWSSDQAQAPLGQGRTRRVRTRRHWGKAWGCSGTAATEQPPDPSLLPKATCLYYKLQVELESATHIVIYTFFMLLCKKGSDHTNPQPPQCAVVWLLPQALQHLGFKQQSHHGFSEGGRRYSKNKLGLLCSFLFQEKVQPSHKLTVV